MTSPCESFRLVRPTGHEARRGLYCLIGGPEHLRGPDAAWSERTHSVRDEMLVAQVQQFEAFAAGLGIKADHQVMAFDGKSVAATCLWVPSPGRSAMLFAPNLNQFPKAAAAVEACVRAALADAASADVALVQVMLEPEDELGAGTFARAGLHRLATLIYMERTPPPAAPSVQLPAGLRLQEYGPACHAALRKVVLGSYEQTLDCPALSGLRDIEDVLAGHKAVGRFDPALWTLVLEGDTPLGCLLLAEIPNRHALDLVYLGLLPAARGRGIGRALMQRMFATGRERGFEVLTLAVDEGNAPALRLYHRFGFTPVTRRVALIRKLDGPSSGPL